MKKKIVLFGGGTGQRGLTIGLCQRQCAITRIVPAWDNGGSSAALRSEFGILSVGDIRQALMTLAHGEGRVDCVVKFFNARLSEDASPADLAAEFDYYASPNHPLLKATESGIRGAILNYLGVFRARMSSAFDLRRGSIGNFVIVGAYFAHNMDINTAIFVFRKLCSIEGNVWPATTAGDLHLQAHLSNGEVVAGQAQITSMGRSEPGSVIENIILHGGDQGCVSSTNLASIEAIHDADLLVFGPGSFYTSVLPHLLVKGVASAIAHNTSAPRLVIGNIMECNETVNRTLASMVADLEVAFGSSSDSSGPLVSHIFANRRPTPFPTIVNGFAYLSMGDFVGNTEVAAFDLEDPWQRGKHDPNLLADMVTRLIS